MNPQCTIDPRLLKLYNKILLIFVLNLVPIENSAILQRLGIFLPFLIIFSKNIQNYMLTKCGDFRSYLAFLDQQYIQTNHQFNELVSYIFVLQSIPYPINNTKYITLKKTYIVKIEPFKVNLFPIFIKA